MSVSEVGGFFMRAVLRAGRAWRRHTRGAAAQRASLRRHGWRAARGHAARAPAAGTEPRSNTNLNAAVPRLTRFPSALARAVDETAARKARCGAHVLREVLQVDNSSPPPFYPRAGARQLCAAAAMSGAAPLRDLVLFLREADERGGYAAAAAAHGLRSAHVRVLSFAPANEGALDAIVRRGGAGFGGLLVTSPQGAAALLRACASAGGAPAALAALPAWTVGAQAAHALAGIGMAATVADSAEELLPLIGGGGAPLLYLAGSKRLEVLPAGLRARGVPFEELLVYRTEALAADDVGGGLAAALAAAAEPPPRRLLLVVFSPSGLDALASCSLGQELLRRAIAAAAAAPAQTAAAAPSPSGAGGAADASVALVAFGKTTAAAIAARGLPVAATTPSPDAAGVGAALRALLPPL
jgi:uroporphyrinogen-III synthase